MQTQVDELGSGKISVQSGASVLLLCATLLAGCANPGPPRPPSLQLPSLVGDLSAERVGDRVLLHWTTPSQTTDKLDIRGALTAEICRSAGAPIANTKKSFAACVMVKRVPAVPGPSSAWDDLPVPLLADPVTLLTYRVEIFNAAGRSSGKSTVAAYSSAGAAPSPAASLTATASEAGAVIRWKKDAGGENLAVDLLRKNLSAPATPTRKPASLPVHRGKSVQPGNTGPSDSNEVHLRADGAEASQAAKDGFAGTVDTSAVMGQTYSYIAQQVRLATLDGHALEIRSQPAPAVTVEMRDTFPPKSPTGLATIPGLADAANGSPTAAYIDLSWEPNSEPDLAGYLLYRQLARPNGDPQGPLGKMTPLPIAAPAYRDVAVAPGQRYIYSVTAVDASGNESAPSAKAQEVAAAQNVGSPH